MDVAAASPEHVAEELADAGQRDEAHLCWQILSNFRRSVLGCIDSYDSENRRILQLFSRSTRLAYFCSAPNSKFQQNLVKNFANFCKILIKLQNFAKFAAFFTKSSKLFSEILLKFCGWRAAEVC